MSTIFKTLIARTIIMGTILLLCASMTMSADLDLSFLKLYGYFEGGERGAIIYKDNREIVIKKGEHLRLEFSEYKELDGVTPDIIDVEATIANRSEQLIKNIEVRLSISPKVASFVYFKDYTEKWNIEETERTAEWFNPIVLERKQIGKMDAKSTTRVVFEKINLGKMIDGYVAKELWPTEIKFEVSIEPQGKEDTFRNNTMFRLLEIQVPVY